MKLNNVHFNGKLYPTRVVEIKGYGKRRIAGERLEEALFENDQYVSDEAREIDSTVFFFVKDSYLGCLDDKALAKKVEKEL